VVAPGLGKSAAEHVADSEGGDEDPRQAGVNRFINRRGDQDTGNGGEVRQELGRFECRLGLVHADAPNTLFS